MGTPPVTDDGEPVSVTGIWSAIEQVVPRDSLADALATFAAFVDDDWHGDAEWVARYSTVRGFIRLLIDVINFGAVEAGAPVVEALSRLSAGDAQLSRGPGSAGTSTACSRSTARGTISSARS